MICKKCQRSLRSSEGLKCATCESKFHLNCVSETCQDRRDSGDRSYQWKCALCQNYANKILPDSPDSSRDNINLLHAINAISEKFELVNKIQLPKLNTDLAQIKIIADRIERQNEDILRKIHEIEARKKSESHFSPPAYRKRNVRFSPKPDIAVQSFDSVPPSPKNTAVKYKTRRRSYVLHKIFSMLNERVNRLNSPRKNKCHT